MNQVSYLTLVSAELRQKLQLSKGWWKKIAEESNVRPTMLKRFARDENYNAGILELIRIEAWFQNNGVKRIGPQGKDQSALKEARRQIDIEDAIA